MSDPAIAIHQLHFQWPGTAEPLLQIEQLQLEAGARLFLQGPSGSGKSTLLNLIAGVQTHYQGSLRVCGQALEQLRPSQRDQLRADCIGLLFQQFNLLPWLTPVDNVSLACRFSRRRRQQAVARSGSVQAEAERLLEELGLDALLTQPRPVNALSIGQQQRVAAARALIGSPPLIIADEPTSALDSEHRDRFVDLLLEECRRNAAALLFVSHDRSLARHFDQVLSLQDAGRAQEAAC